MIYYVESKIEDQDQVAPYLDAKASAFIILTVVTMVIGLT